MLIRRAACAKLESVAVHQFAKALLAHADSSAAWLHLLQEHAALIKVLTERVAVVPRHIDKAGPDVCSNAIHLQSWLKLLANQVCLIQERLLMANMLCRPSRLGFACDAMMTSITSIAEFSTRREQPWNGQQLLIRSRVGRGRPHDAGFRGVNNKSSQCKF